MGVISQFRTYFAVLPKARRHRADLMQWLIRRPQLLAGITSYELAGRFLASSMRRTMAAIAWENHRGRLYQALGVRPSGFSDGTTCAVPEP